MTLAAPFALWGQERPLNITTTVSAGYYSAISRGDDNQTLDFTPVSARFDVSGYLLAPDLLTFEGTPQITSGPQSSEAGFQDGNGIVCRATLLRKSPAPLTFHYADVHATDAYFGSLTQLSGYTIDNRNRDIGVTWEVRPPHLPDTTFDWGKSGTDATSGTAGIADYLSHGDHLNADTIYNFHGWGFGGFYHRQRQESNLLASMDGGAATGSLRDKVEQYQGSVKRSFLHDSDWYAEAGEHTTTSILFALPISQNTRYASTNLHLFQRRRWKTSLRGNYSSNLGSQLLAQAAAALAGPQSVAPQNALLPFSYGISSFNGSGATTVDLGRGFGVFASVERNKILSSRQDGPLNASYWTTSGGATYQGRYHWGSFSAGYTHEYGLGSVTGQSGKIQGQDYSLSAQRGRSGGLEFDGSVHGNNQRIENALSFSNKSISTEGGVSDRLIGGLSARVGGGWQWGLIKNGGNEFRTNGFTARAGLNHRLVQATAAMNQSVSDSLPIYGQLLSGLGLESLAVSPTQVIPSDYRSMSFTLHANPLRKLEISGSWTRSRQHLDGFLSNDFAMLSAYATYHFRKIDITSGLIQSNQTFSLFPETLRKRWYVRVSRTMRIL